MTTVTVRDLSAQDRANLLRWVALDGAAPGTLEAASGNLSEQAKYWTAANAWANLSERAQMAHAWVQDLVLEALRERPDGQFGFEAGAQDVSNFASVVFRDGARVWGFLEFVSPHTLAMACDRVTRENLDAKRKRGGRPCGS